MENEGLSFQDQFQVLLDTVHATDGSPYSLAAISQGTGISVQNLSYLADGTTQHPRLETLRRLCRFYDITLDYFGCKTEADCRSYLMQRAAEGASLIVREIDQEAETLTPSAKGRILRFLERFRHLGGSGKH